MQQMEFDDGQGEEAKETAPKPNVQDIRDKLRLAVQKQIHVRRTTAVTIQKKENMSESEV